ncbi:MAG: ABC transporter substrate-binding protein [Bacteroidota bacterium]
MNRIQSFCLLGIVLTLSGLMACQSSPSTSSSEVPGVTDSTIVIGSWGPLSGPAASWGVVLYGMDAYFQLINEQGGIHGRKIRFVYKDDAYDPSRTVGAVRELVLREEAFALVGGIGTATGMAVKPFIAEQGIPWVSPCSGATAMAFPPEPNLFSFFPLYQDEAEIQVNFVLDSLKKTQIALLYQQDDFGNSARISTERVLADRGLTLAAAVPIDPSEGDLTSHLALLQQSGAEVVLLWVGPRHAAILLNRSKVSGYSPQWVGCTALSDLAIMSDLTDGAWTGAIFGFYGELPDSDHPDMQRYRAALTRFHPDVRWGNFSSGGFMYAEPLVEALQRAGPALTRESLLASLESLHSFQGIGPRLTYGPDLRQGHRSLYLARATSASEAVRLTDFLEAQQPLNALFQR